MESAVLKAWYKRIIKKLWSNVPTPTSTSFPVSPIPNFTSVCPYPIVRVQMIGAIKPRRLAELKQEIEADPELADNYVHAAMIMWCEEHAPEAYMIATCDNHCVPFVYEPEPLTIEEEPYVGMWAFIFHDEDVAAQFKLTFSDTTVITEYHFYFERTIVDQEPLLTYRVVRSKFRNTGI